MTFLDSIGSDPQIAGVPSSPSSSVRLATIASRSIGCLLPQKDSDPEGGSAAKPPTRLFLRRASALSFRHRASAAAVFAHSQWRRRSQSHNYPFSRPARPFIHISACVLADPRYGTARGFDRSTLPAATCRLGQTCLLKESFHLRTHRNCPNDGEHLSSSMLPSNSG